MENYTKGKNVEEEWEIEKIPIPNLPENFTWMQVKGGSKMFNLLEYGLNAFNETGMILWSGSGAAICKTVSCAEIMKKRHKEKGLHQINKICYRKVQEFWDPVREDLEQLVVTREVPTIHILLSESPLDEQETGYQAPNVKNPFFTSTEEYNQKKELYQQNKKFQRINPQQFSDFGLRSNANRQNKGSSSSSAQPEKKKKRALLQQTPPK